MADFFYKTNEKKQEFIAAGRDSFDDETQKSIRDEYLAILEAGRQEYEPAAQGKTSITYCNEERCLLARLLEYAVQHLLFAMNFTASFGNNNAEQGARF
jgi:hypothetical protein